MAQSTITSKNQTTVPKEIRERLGLQPRDVLNWEVVEGSIRVVPAQRGFLERMGSVKVGPGSVVEDVREARRLRGRKGQ